MINSMEHIVRQKKHGWFEELLQYFTIVGSKYNRCIYACLFSDNTVYVGLTYDLHRRIRQHLTDDDSTVYRHTQETGLIPTFIQETKYINYAAASIMEGEILKSYCDKGFTPLNRTKTGGLGSKDIVPRKWTKEKCIEIAKKCSSYKEFREKYQGALQSSIRGKFIEEIKKILPPKLGRSMWTKETALEEAKRYVFLKDLRENSYGCYSFLLRHNLIKEVRKQMKLLQRDEWSFEEVYIEALKYNNKTDFRKNSPKCYRACKRKGWYDKVCSHMNNDNTSKLIYTKDFVIKVLKDYEYMEQLKKSDDKRIRGCYWWLKKHKKLIEFKKYLKETDIVTLWTDERAYKELGKYCTYTEFRVGSGTCYQYFVRHKRLNEIKEYYEKIRL